VDHVGNEDSNWIRILPQVDWDGIDQDRYDRPASGASKYHVNEPICEWCTWTDLRKEFASMQVGVSQHAHVFL
jgi:hypothetical protein